MTTSFLKPFSLPLSLSLAVGFFVPFSSHTQEGILPAGDWVCVWMVSRRESRWNVKTGWSEELANHKRLYSFRLTNTCLSYTCGTLEIVITGHRKFWIPNKNQVFVCYLNIVVSTLNSQQNMPCFLGRTLGVSGLTLRTLALLMYFSLTGKMPQKNPTKSDSEKLW